MEIDLYKLYDENIKDFEEIDKIINEEGVSLFGASSRGYFDSEYLLNNNYKINYFIDNDINKCHTKLNGINIISLNEYGNNLKGAILIDVHHYIEEIKYDINKYNSSLKYMTFNKWFILKNFDNIINFINTLYDEKSKYISKMLIYSKLIEDINFCHNLYDDDQYFSISKFKYYSTNEVFVDMGAYTGDTVEKFLNNNYGTFKKIYAFEPSIKQFKAMSIRIERLKKEWAIDDDKISLLNLGLSNKIAKSNLYNNTSLFSNYIKNDNLYGADNINLVTLDSFLCNKNYPITFLKADIEGEELNMLKGAVETIKRYKPKMAISVYHRADDLLTIPKFIKGLVPDYNLALRHHSIGFDETVLYCWIDQTRPDQTRPDQTRPDQTIITMYGVHMY